MHLCGETERDRERARIIRAPFGFPGISFEISFAFVRIVGGPLASDPHCHVVRIVQNSRRVCVFRRCSEDVLSESETDRRASRCTIGFYYRRLREARSFNSIYKYFYLSEENRGALISAARNDGKIATENS